MIWFLAPLLLVVSVSSTTVEDGQVEESEREAKILPIFQVVKFPVSLPKIPKHLSVKKLRLRLLASKSEVRLQNVHIVLDSFQVVEGFDILCF